MTRMWLIPVEGAIRIVDVHDTYESQARAIGAERLDRVSITPVALDVTGWGWALLYDEDAAVRPESVNGRASVLYGTPETGEPLIGDVLLTWEQDNGDELLTHDVDDRLAAALLQTFGITTAVAS